MTNSPSFHYKNLSDVLDRVAHVIEFNDIPIVDINQRGIFNNTPLMVVIHWQEKESPISATEILLKNGADPNLAGEYGNTALHDAATLGSIEIVRLLIKYGANKKILNSSNQTAYDLAISAYRNDVADYLAIEESSNISHNHNSR